jgi:23S rRNA pseudouridine1911/1915/1917 synthase
VTYTVSLPPATDANVEGESLPLKIVYEDDSLIVVDKPAGLVVHPAAGHAAGTLVNALVAHCGESLSGIGGVKRPGIVHRLDKDTSGLLVVAKTDAAHRSLAAQFKSHGLDGRLHRSYLAFVWGKLPRPKGTIDARLWRSRANRMKIAVARGELGRSATTHYDVLETFPGGRPAGEVSLLRLVLETGRTHQIRVHLAHIGHPVLGDPVYGSGFKTRLVALGLAAKDAAAALGRQALHAEQLAFEHPITGEKMSFNSPLPPDLERLAKALGREISTRRPPEKMLKRRS